MKVMNAFRNMNIFLWMTSFANSSNLKGHNTVAKNPHPEKAGYDLPKSTTALNDELPGIWNHPDLNTILPQEVPPDPEHRAPPCPHCHETR